MDTHANGTAAWALPRALHAELRRLDTVTLARIALLAAWLLALRLPRTVRLWRVRSRTRAALAELDDHLLRDIGLERNRARAECRKWFWQA